MEDLTPLQNGQIAVAAAVATTLSLQPTLYWKTACAHGLPLSIDPRVVYRGTAASLANEIVQMGSQFVITGLAKRALAPRKAGAPAAELLAGSRAVADGADDADAAAAPRGGRGGAEGARERGGGWSRTEAAPAHFKNSNAAADAAAGPPPAAAPAAPGAPARPPPPQLSRSAAAAAAAVGASMLGGALTAVLACPIELAMIQQQLRGGSAWAALASAAAARAAPRAAVPRNFQTLLGIFRGLGPTMARDAFYVGGMLGVAPLVQAQLLAALATQTPPQTLAPTAAAPTPPAAAALASQPPTSAAAASAARAASAGASAAASAGDGAASGPRPTALGGGGGGVGGVGASSQRLASLGGALVGGTAGAVLSHPWDVLKTALQGDLRGATYGHGPAQAARAIVATRGPRGLMAGWGWRTANIVISTFIVNETFALLAPPRPPHSNSS